MSIAATQQWSPVRCESCVRLQAGKGVGGGGAPAVGRDVEIIRQLLVQREGHAVQGCGRTRTPVSREEAAALAARGGGDGPPCRACATPDA